MSFTTKVSEHVCCGYSISTIWTFSGIENKYKIYRGEDCMKKSCEYLIDHAMKIANFEKKKMIPLTKEQQELPGKRKVCYICEKVWT